MSVVVVKNFKDRIELVADSMFVAGEDQRETGNKLEKINEHFAIGGVGSLFLFETLVLFAKENEPDSNTTKGMLEYQKKFFTYLKDLYPNKTVFDFSFTIAYKNKVFYLFEWGLYEVKENDFYCSGSGATFAKAIMSIGESPEKAVEVACKNNIYCAKPIKKVVLDKKKKEEKKK